MTASARSSTPRWRVRLDRVPGWGRLVGAAIAFGIVAGRIIPTLPMWAWGWTWIASAAVVVVAAVPELGVFALIVGKQVAPVASAVSVLSICLGAVAIARGALRFTPPVTALSFGLFLLVALPTVSGQAAWWDRPLPALVFPGTNWPTFPMTSYDQVAALALVAMPGFALMAALYVRDRSSLERLMAVFVISSLYPIVMGLHDKITGDYFYREGSAAIVSLFYHPNGFAVYLVAVVPILIGHGLGTRVREMRWLSLVAGVLGTACLFWTYTRGGWLAFLLAITVGAILARRVKELALVGIAILTLAVATGVASGVTERFADLSGSRALTTRAPNSWIWRLNNWERMIDEIPAVPLTGIGYAGYEGRTVEVFGVNNLWMPTDLSPDWRLGFGAHNDFVEQYVETGLPGLLLWTTLLGSLAYYPARVWRRFREPLALGACVGVVGLIGMSLSDNVAYYDFSWFLAMGVVAAVHAFGIRLGTQPISTEDSVAEG